MKVSIHVNNIDIKRLSYGATGKMARGFLFKLDEIRLPWSVTAIVLL